ncbi:MAG: Biofilm growth-associated repressor [Pseudomonadota bacterium]
MPLPSSAVFKRQAQLDEMADNAKQATSLLKALAHEGRLMILCYLSSGEKSVTELEELLSLRQPAVSQQLARLRADDLIEARRDGKTIYYSISDERAEKVMELVYELFCAKR